MVIRAVGRRVYLRAPTRRDAATYVAAVHASRALHGRWVSQPETEEAYVAWLRGAAAGTVERHLVFRREDDALAGFVNLNSIIGGSLQQAYVGYAAFAPHHRLGLMTEALDLVVHRAFTELGLHRVEANIQPDNTASKALARRCCFTLEGYSPRFLKVRGRWRDHERWAINAEEHQRHRARR